MEEIQAAKKPMNKTEILTALGEATGLTKQQVGDLFDELSKLIGKNLGNDGPGTFTLPACCKSRSFASPQPKNTTGSTPSPRKKWSSRPSPPRTSSRSRP